MRLIYVAAAVLTACAAWLVLELSSSESSHSSSILECACAESTSRTAHIAPVSYLPTPAPPPAPLAALAARLRCPDPQPCIEPERPHECDAAKAQERYEDAPEGSEYSIEHQVRICIEGQWSPWVAIGDDDEEPAESTDEEPAPAYTPLLPWSLSHGWYNLILEE